eukprot:SAG31_NODE_2635_length_5340_cov_15.869681_8_plen_50_part_01
MIDCTHLRSVDLNLDLRLDLTFRALPSSLLSFINLVQLYGYIWIEGNQSP